MLLLNNLYKSNFKNQTNCKKNKSKIKIKNSNKLKLIKTLKINNYLINKNCYNNNNNNFNNNKIKIN